MKRKTIPRDISWLSFNDRVLQEASDPSNPLRERVKFLGIFSNNNDEFFRVRVATLKRMAEFGSKLKNMHLEQSPGKILDKIQQIVLQQTEEFNRVWEQIRKEMEKEKIFLLNEKQLNKEQQRFVQVFFEDDVRSNIIPLMIESIPQLPYLREKSIYLSVVLSRKDGQRKRKYAIIEVPSKVIGRFIKLPSPPGEHHIILLEDVIRYNLRSIFSYFGYNRYESWVFKVTKDAEMDIDNDVSTSVIQKIEKGLKNRRKGKAVRFIYDKEMDAGLLDFLMRKLNLSSKDSIIPGGRIHNFKHFMDFPDIFQKKGQRKKPFPHPLFKNTARVTDTLLKQDVMLHFPYHSFNTVIDLLREAAIDPDVTAIKITAYRLASDSKIINALINAVRNGKQVTVMLELRARFDEEANLEWKERLEEEGVKVLVSIPNLKTHAKLCLIKKKKGAHSLYYGFVSTGNLNERTAMVYGDHCLLTANRRIMTDINRIFNYLEKWKTGMTLLKNCSSLIPCPTSLRAEMHKLINKEIKNAKSGRAAGIILKMNSLSDEELIEKLYEAARAGVRIKMVIRGICCMFTENKKFVYPIKAISIVDEYLEHARLFIFYNGGAEKAYISSADWMVRNLDHRVEATCPIYDPRIKKDLIDMMDIQLSDNVKARILDNELSNQYASAVKPGHAYPMNRKKARVEKTIADKEPPRKIRSQLEIYQYLQQKAVMGLPLPGNPGKKNGAATKERQRSADHTLKTTDNE
ncbi:MAG TPA: polyphosphate kinase 1 [Flavitalea sp.]|nr:polyphosphate kinase 1 [Flavitalea sp.]